jgi:hypothetical protein
VTIPQVKTMEVTMIEDQTRPNAVDPSEQARPEQPDQQARPSQVSGAAEPGQRRAPGRKPLFGT